MKKLLGIVFLLSFQLCVFSNPIPVEEIFQKRSYTSFQISPDGQKLACLAPVNGALNIVVFDLEKRQPKVLTGREIDVTKFYWVNDNRIFYSLNQGVSTFSSNQQAGAIFGIDADGGNHNTVLKSYAERAGTAGEKHRGRIDVLNVLEDEEDYVLVTNSSRRRDYPDLYKMNVNSGVLSKVMNNPGYIVGYFYGVKGEILGGLSQSDQNDPKSGAIYWVNKETGEWDEVMKLKSVFDIPEFVGLSADHSKIIVSKKSEDGFMKLYEVSFDDRYHEKLIFEDAEYDLQGVKNLLSLKTRGMIGIRYDRDKPVNHFFNKTYASLYEMIDNAIPDGSNYIYDFDRSGKRILIESISDKKSPEYYLFDLNKGTIEPLGEMFPHLKKLYLPEKTPIAFKASDGHTIHGYLYLPENYNADKRVPLIVNPHGGPWGRDTWGIRWWYDLEPVYFASRGFAVLQVNFRASSGYGKKHEEAADKNWDVTMQDIWDGVQWAIDTGYADKERVGVVGASFGGTATMLSLVYQPEMFQFGINFFGVVDIPEQIKTYYEWDRDIAGDYWKNRIGDPKNEEDKDGLYRWSAINFVENINVPLFLYHGLRDRNVDIEQTRDLVKKLKSVGKKKGKDYEVVYNSDEAHGAYDPVKRVELYKKIDEFIKPFSPAYGN